MALTKDQKSAQLTALKEKLEKAQSVMFAHYIGLDVASVSDLREKLRESNAEMKVGKKTLLRIAMKELDLPEMPEDQLDGPVACIFSYDDPISGAQIAFKFGKDHEEVKLIGGVFEGKALSKEEASTFASLPSRDVLLATFAMMIRSPLVKFASMSVSPLSGFARGLSQLAEKGGVSPQAEAPAKEPKAEAPAEEAKPEEAPKEEAPATEEKPDEETKAEEAATPTENAADDSEKKEESAS